MIDATSDPNPSAKDRSKLAVVTDTGPLLCFGHIPTGVRMFRDRYYERICWPQAVARELERHCRRFGAVGDAAKQWTPRVIRFLGDPVVIEKHQDIADMHSRVQNMMPEDRRDGREGMDQGEAEVLVIARNEKRAMLCNEQWARRVADQLSIANFCAADIIAAEVQGGS
nr:hypothetical protein GCM10020093_064200 [Planobispora longispora]